MNPPPKFSIAAVIIGLCFLFAGVWLLANDIKLRSRATYTEMEVVGKRESKCKFSRRGGRRDPCTYPTVAHTDSEGHKHLFKLRPWRTEKLRWELKKSKNRLEVLYLPNGPSPDDDQVFEEKGMLFLGFVCCLIGIILLEVERRDLVRDRKLEALPTSPPDSFLHIGKRRN